MGTNLKNFGTRTLVGNWWEERQTLNEYSGGNVLVKDMSLELHIRASEESPKTQPIDQIDMTTSYKIDTDPKKLDEQKRIQERIQEIEKRKRLAGTATFQKVSQPGTTTTLESLPSRFIDPHKTRYKTVYQKTFNRPTFEESLSKKSSQAPNQKYFNSLESTWDPNWS